MAGSAQLQNVIAGKCSVSHWLKLSSSSAVNTSSTIETEAYQFQSYYEQLNIVYPQRNVLIKLKWASDIRL